MTNRTLMVEVPARFGWRLLAFAVDAAAVTLIGSMLPGIVGDAWFVPWAAYFVLTTGFLGRTPGKIAVGIHLYAADGRLSWVAVGLREVIGKLVSSAVLGFGFIWIAFDPQKRGLHDMIAGTRAVRLVPRTWPKSYEREVASALARAGEATPEMLTRIPNEHRVPALRAFAAQYREDAVMDGPVLRPTGEVEWF